MSSGRSRRVRKPTARVDSDVSNSKWTDKELNEFFGAYGRYGDEWGSVVRAVSNHSTSDIQTLFAKHKDDLTADGMEAKAFIAIYKQTLAREREAAQAAQAEVNRAAEQAARQAKKAKEEAEREQAKARSKATSKSSTGGSSAAANGAAGGGGPRGTKRVRNSPAKPPASPSSVEANRKRSRKLFAEELAVQKAATRKRLRPRKLPVKRSPVPAEAAGFYETARPAMLREDWLAAQQAAAEAETDKQAGGNISENGTASAATAEAADAVAATATAGAAAGGQAAAIVPDATKADGSVAASEDATSSGTQNEEWTNTNGRAPRTNLTNLEMHWCVYDSFYAGIDQPFFTFCEFRECLIRMGLPRRAAGPVSRAEWNTAKRRLQEEHGVPRRFSKAFCRDEHERLVRYRERAREQLNGQRAPSTGLGSLLASHGGNNGGMDTPALLHVGQPVVAIHPKDRLPHFGKVLTAEVTQCRVQFDRGDLGVQLLDDTDIMPFNDMVLPWADGPMLLPQLSALAESAESQMQEETAARPPPPAQVVVDLRIPTETLKLLDQKEKLVAGMREVSNKAAHAAVLESGQPPPRALVAEYGRLVEDLRAVDSRLGPLLVHMRRYTAAANGTIATDDVPHPAEVEGATSTSEKLVEQLRTTCTAKATEMMMLAAKDPRISAGREASGDDLTEAEKGKLLSLVSKCVAMVAALQHMGQYIASEQRQSLVMQGQRQAVLDALDLMLTEMQQTTLRDSGLRDGRIGSAMQTLREICG